MTNDINTFRQAIQINKPIKLKAKTTLTGRHKVQFTKKVISKLLPTTQKKSNLNT